MRAVGRFVVRLLVAVQARPTRRRYGAELLEIVLERAARVRAQRGRRALLAHVPREIGGMIALAAATRVDARRRARRQARRRDRRAAGRQLSPETPRLPGKGPSHAMDTLLQDVRYALRKLVDNPGFTIAAVAAIALGVGANTAVFSVVDAVLLEPLPFAEPDELYSVWEKNPERGWVEAQVAAANYLDWRERADSFVDMGAHNDWLVNLPLTTDGEPEMVHANQVTGNLFDVLGVEPLIGPGFEPDDSWAGGEAKVILSHAFWTSRFGADTGVVGQRITLAGVDLTIAGVMPEGFVYPLAFFGGSDGVPDIDAWVPTAWDPASRERVFFRRAHGMRVVGRLADGVSPDEAEAELASIAASLEAEYPETNEQMGNGITPLHEWVVGDSDLPLLIMFAAVGFVLLIACANVANMLLARASARSGEMAIRNALGATRGRLVRQGLTESLLLSLAGGVIGIAAGVWSINGLVALSPAGIPRLQGVGLDLDLLLFTAAAVVGTALVFGLVPALKSARPQQTAALGGRSRTSGRATAGGNRLLVAAEVALVLPLVVGAGLTLRTLSALQQVDPGFDPENVLVAEISLPGSIYPEPEDQARFWWNLQAALDEMPGVVSAAASSRLPFRNQRWSSDFTTDGWPEDRYGINVRHGEVTTDFFETMRIPIVRGRGIDETAGELPLVVVINQALADLYFPGEDPIGKRVTFDRVADADSVWREIIGVAADVKRERLSVATEPGFYAPVVQDPTRGMHLLVRTEGEPLAMVEAMKARVRELDPELPVFGITTLEEVHAGAMANERFLLTLLGVFATVGLVLAALGIYGVIAYATARRTREIGIRVALGARGSDIARLIVGGGMLPVFAGVAVGVVGGLLTARVMASLLFQVRPADPMTFVGVTFLLTVVALAASVIPARRAMRVDPVVALQGR